MEDPSFDDLRPVGVRARVLQLFKLPDGSVKALVEGDERVRAERVVASEPHFLVEYAPVRSTDAGSARSRSLARRVADEFVRYVHLHPQLADEAQFVVQQAEGPDELADIVAAHLQTEAGEKQALLEIVSTQQRLLALLESLAEENAVLGIEQEIGLKVQQRIEGAQRQMLLHEKLRVLRDEIEEAGEAADEDIAVYARRAAEAELSPAARKLVTRELTKLRQAPPMSPEVAVIRGFLDTVLELPWGRLARADVDVPGVARHLERTHYGLRDVKDRILEYLAVCRMRDRRGSRCRRCGGRRPAGHDPLSGRPARHRQEQRRAEHRRCARPSLRARRARRRARRGRGPRASPHLHRGDARAHRRRPREGRRRQPRHAPRRARQARQRLAGQPRRGADGGARPGAQPRLPRQLPGGRVRPQPGLLHRHGERRGRYPGHPVRPARDHPSERLHHAGEAGHRPASPAAACRPRHRAAPRGRALRPRRAPRHRPRLHARGGRARTRARAAARRPQGRAQAPRGRPQLCPWPSPWASCAATSARRTGSRPSCRARRAWGRASASPTPPTAARCSPSRRPSPAAVASSS